MSDRRWRRALILGGVRSGKSEFAEALAGTAAPVRYVATARRDPDDVEWERRIAAHQGRRPPAWTTDDVGADPTDLPPLLATAEEGETVLVDELGSWVAATMAAGVDPVQLGVELADSVHASAATLVLVSSEVGLSLVPLTPAGRTFVDALGLTNQAVAAACDAVVLVIAGNAVPVKGGL
jgi:adenosyl cobinamide kinase/adenosyl cobinamide phosphate guanylyltransferase